MELQSLIREFISLQERGFTEDKIKEFFQNLVKVDLTKFNWVRDLVEQIHLKDRASKTALHWRDMSTGEEETLTYHQLSLMANKVLNHLRKAGMRKGDPLYLMTRVHPLHWATFMASLKGGFVLVPSATNLTVNELKYRFSDLRPKAIVSDTLRARTVEEALGEMKVEKFLIDGKKQGWNSLEDGEVANAEAEDTMGNDVVINYFTSGTTGMPKRVIHTAVSYPLGSLSTASIIGVKESDRHLNLSATGWAKFAWSSFFSPLLVGSTIVGLNYEGRLDSRKYLSEVEALGVTSFCAPPTAWRQFVTLNLKEFRMDKLRSVVSAGEPLNPEVMKAWREGTGLVIRDFYGQTETTAMVGNFPFMAVKPGSMGKPHPLYNVTLVDDGGREITRPNEIGHIAVRLVPRPLGLFMGYSDQKKNEEAFRYGYYFTGDKAYMDEDGYFYFVGRGDDLIKTSDYRVGPFEVESALLEHPAVAEAAVVASPDPVRYQLVKAFVVLKPGYVPSEQLAKEIREKVKSLLSYYKVPRIIEFVSELPKTISGKIRRVELRRLEEERRRRGEKGEHEYFFTQ